MNPLTMGIVGGVLIVLAATVIYVENRIKEPKEKKEEYLQEAEDEIDRRFNENIYKPEPSTFIPATGETSVSWRNERREGGKSKRKRTKGSKKSKKK